MGSDRGPRCLVAGRVNLPHVNASGVTYSVLHEYPERIGELALRVPSRDGPW